MQRFVKLIFTIGKTPRRWLKVSWRELQIRLKVQEEIYRATDSFRLVGTSFQILDVESVATTGGADSSANGSSPLTVSPDPGSEALTPSLIVSSVVTASNLASTFPFRGQLVEVVKRARNLPSSFAFTTSSGIFHTTAEVLRRKDAPVFGCMAAPVARATSRDIFVVSSTGLRSRFTFKFRFLSVIEVIGCDDTKFGLSEY